MYRFVLELKKTAIKQNISHSFVLEDFVIDILNLIVKIILVKASTSVFDKTNVTEHFFCSTKGVHTDIILVFSQSS